MTTIIPLLAAGPPLEILLKLAVPIIFVLVYVLNYILGGANRQNQRKPGQRPGGQQNPDRPAVDLNEEISQFLKRAADRRKQQGPGKQAAQQNPAQQNPAQQSSAQASGGGQQKKTQRPARQPQKPAIAPARRLVQQETQPAQRKLGEPTGESIAEHVRERLSSEEFTVRASHMIDDLKRADQEREAHREKMFDHKLGKLAGGGAAATEPTTNEAPNTVVSAPHPLAALLSSRDNFRSAFILQEILKPPME